MQIDVVGAGGGYCDHAQVRRLCERIGRDGRLVGDDDAGVANTLRDLARQGAFERFQMMVERQGA